MLTTQFGRGRAVLLLDDAALSLSDQYLIAFFEIFRVLKVEGIAPKASVYPGSTQYGPTFHASHEVEEVPLWLSVEDSEYSQIMGDIAARRLTAEQAKNVSPEVLELLKYIAFGVPRVFLRLLREFLSEASSNSQSKVNKIIERQVELIEAEYDSLGMKLKQFSTVVKTGKRFFENSVREVAAAQTADLARKNITLGLQQTPDRHPLTERMLKFLIEIGLLFPLHAVSHGPNRKYDRYIPHLGFLLPRRSVSRGKKKYFSRHI